MSTDAWIEEHWIGEAVLPRPRRAPKLPALPLPHAPTCSRGNAALAAHAQSRDSARHPGDGLSARQDGRNVVDQQERKLTQPTSSQRFFARSIGSSWSYAKSARSKLNAMKCCSWHNRALPRHSLCGSRALGPNSLSSFTLRVCSASLKTDGSWRPMPAWLPVHGRVAASTKNRVSRRPVIGVCAPQWSSLLGCG